jgi:hypothetical protein
MIRVLLQEDLGHPVVSGAFPVPNFEEELLTLIASMVKS